MITKHGQNAATAIANNGKKAVKLITDYGGNAAKAIANYGDNVVKAITNHGDDAVKLITKHGDDVACFVNGKTHTNIITDWNALERDAKGVTQTSLFVLNDADARAVLAQTSTDPKLLAKKLGLSEDTFDTGAYLIHTDRSCVENIRTSAIDTLGANVNLNDCIIPI